LIYIEDFDKDNPRIIVAVYVDKDQRKTSIGLPVLRFEENGNSADMLASIFGKSCF
jgi:cell division protein FtsI/penicillin-binding protein 2